LPNSPKSTQIINKPSGNPDLHVRLCLIGKQATKMFVYVYVLTYECREEEEEKGCRLKFKKNNLKN
jgi:hypothetical protein